jgi:hypothetical protein
MARVYIITSTNSGLNFHGAVICSDFPTTVISNPPRNQGRNLHENHNYPKTRTGRKLFKRISIKSNWNPCPTYNIKVHQIKSHKINPNHVAKLNTTNFLAIKLLDMGSQHKLNWPFLSAFNKLFYITLFAEHDLFVCGVITMVFSYFGLRIWSDKNINIRCGSGILKRNYKTLIEKPHTPETQTKNPDLK